ncbi:MAG TPA: hypothetical protein VFF73_03595 [Planctomycetota bacterium]|nr:hypothetical protein [Planctomycetota bacterium]
MAEVTQGFLNGDGDGEVDRAFTAELRRRVDGALSGARDPGDEYRVVLERLRKTHEERHRAGS